MKESVKYLMIACMPVKEEILKIREEFNITYPLEFLPENLHQSPDRLREYLVDYLGQLCGIDYVLLPMGMCGNGTVGISSPTATLIIPRCEDCISLLLSTDLLNHVERPKYTYFFSEGWLSGEKSFYQEYLYAEKKYGAKLTEEILKLMYNNYRSFGYLETGTGKFEEAAEKIKPISEIVNADIRRLEAPCGVLKKMILLNIDENFIKIPPKQKIAAEDFGILK